LKRYSIRTENALTTAHTPGKVILFGDHALVCGRPAIAVPVTEVRGCAAVEDGPPGRGAVIHAVDLHLRQRVGEPMAAQSPAYPLEATVRSALRTVATAIVRALGRLCQGKVQQKCGSARLKGLEWMPKTFI
jgi:hypothetical protein